MSRVVVSNKFKRAFRKFTRRNKRLQEKIESTIIKISEDTTNPTLGTHKLEGKLTNLLSCSCGYDCRIIFSVEKQPETGETIIVLLDVGTHDEVY